MASNRDMERIEREIETVRRDAGEILAEIEHRLSPRRAMELGRAAIRGSYPMQDVRRTVEDGALPMLVIAAGLGWWAFNLTRRRDGGAVYRAESEEWRAAPTIEELETDVVLADESVPEHHVHIADSRHGAKSRRPPTPEELLDLEHSHKSAAGSARVFRE